MRENTEERVGHLGAWVGQIVIIGGGPAGYEAALVAAQLDAQVMVVEAEGAGGACVLSDCVPSKTFIAASDVVTGYRDTEEFGVHAGGLAAVSVDAEAGHARVQRLAQGPAPGNPPKGGKGRGAPRGRGGRRGAPPPPPPPPGRGRPAR